MTEATNATPSNGTTVVPAEQGGNAAGATPVADQLGNPSFLTEGLPPAAAPGMPTVDPQPAAAPEANTGSPTQPNAQEDMVAMKKQLEETQAQLTRISQENANLNQNLSTLAPLLQQPTARVEPLSEMDLLNPEKVQAHIQQTVSQEVARAKAQVQEEAKNQMMAAQLEQRMKSEPTEFPKLEGFMREFVQRNPQVRNDPDAVNKVWEGAKKLREERLSSGIQEIAPRLISQDFINQVAAKMVELTKGTPIQSAPISGPTPPSNAGAFMTGRPASPLLPPVSNSNDAWWSEIQNAGPKSVMYS